MNVDVELSNRKAVAEHLADALLQWSRDQREVLRVGNPPWEAEWFIRMWRDEAGTLRVEVSAKDEEMERGLITHWVGFICEVFEIPPESFRGLP